ncbi:helix-turn-helix domain-containing protein, partial [Rothia sp. HMSC068F09]|uniref:helix-turn-helix domain-containing protein n=1 Tax=Rothia sp. HMSC068F09 TaxID=1739378 RepID=UPI001FEF83FE
PLKQWCRLYREGGAQALKPKPKGRPKGSVRVLPPTREEELAERVRKLEAQVVYLKKSIALKAYRRSQTGTKP